MTAGALALGDAWPLLDNCNLLVLCGSLYFGTTQIMLSFSICPELLVDVSPCVFCYLRYGVLLKLFLPSPYATDLNFSLIKSTITFSVPSLLKMRLLFDINSVIP